MRSPRIVTGVVLAFSWSAGLWSCSEEERAHPQYLETYVVDIQSIGHGGTYSVSYELREGTDPRWVAREIERYLANENGARESLGAPFFDESPSDGKDLGLREEWAYILADLWGIQDFQILVSDTVEDRERKVAELLQEVRRRRRHQE